MSRQDDSSRNGMREAVDEALGRRIAEIASAAGVPHSRASLEVLYYLPKDFLTRYTELFDASLKLDSGGVGGADVGEVGKAQVDGRWKGVRPGVTGGGKRYKEFWVVRNDDLLDLKKRIDKRLRTLGRDIAYEMSEGRGDSDERRERVRCGRCGRILGNDWKFCAECGEHRPVGSD